MNASTIQYQIGDKWMEHQIDPAQSGAMTLAEWLEAHHIMLNTRCGGRGLCQGCEVITAFGNQSRQRVKSCQTLIASLPEGRITLHIPQTSQRNLSLYGVSAFEVRPSDPLPRRFKEGIGLAVDVGTTTVAAALWDYTTGQCLAHGARANAQRSYGDNVLARISHAVEKTAGVRELQQALIHQSILPLLNDLLQQAGIGAEAIVHGMAAGNTIMLHSLVGAPLDGFCRYPFKPLFIEGQNHSAGALGFPVDFPLMLPPGLGPFVGADIVVGALAVGLLDAESPALLIDFGTNGEILLKHRGGYLATATAAGPAFEGGRLSCGMPAGPGSISSLSWANGDWQFTLTGGNHHQPRGITGAAYIDFLALAYQNGIMNAFGRFNRNHPAVSTGMEDGETVAYVSIDLELRVTEVDIAELLQAKAAMGGGVAALLEEAGLAASDLRSVIVAGGFGYHLQPAHAIAIGLLPAVRPEIISLVGNASLAGASLTLLHTMDKTMEQLRQTCRVVELNQVSSFENHYTDALCLPDED